MAVGLVSGVPGVGSLGTATAADGGFAQMRERWITYMLGDAPDMGDPDIAAFVTSRTSRAQNWWTSMDTSAGRTYLWSDVSDFSTAKVDSSIASSVDRLRSMAYAYRGVGSQLQGDENLRDAILGGLDWIITNYYKPGTAITGNWWNWEIGTPRYLGDLLVLMHDSVSVDLRQRTLAAIDAFCGDPTRRTEYSTTVEVGANRTDKALNVILRGIVADDASKVAQGRDALDQVYAYVTSGNGFYEDGSFVFHGSIAYTGGYGPPLLESLGASWYLLSGTAWAVTSPKASNVYAWLDNAFIPVNYRGAVMDMVRGRKITRETETDHSAGQGVAGNIALFAASAGQQRSDSYKSQIKAWMVDDPDARFVYGTSLYITQLLKAIRADASISPTPEQPSARTFNGMGRAVQKGENFAVGISTFSDRIAGYTSLNGENLKGWWTGAGQTAIYAGDSKEFDQNYWATVDMTRLPGITTDGTASGTQGTFNTSSWAGGSTAGGAYGAMGMDFSMQNVTGSDLSGKKSWFMLGNRMVALGSGVSGSGTVETVVDNRIVPGTAGDVKLGSTEVTDGTAGVTANASYGYLAGADQANSVGYVFLDSPSVKALNETRQGAWADVATGGSTAVKTNQFGSFAIQHGTGASNNSYAYAVLPGASEAQTRAAAGDLGFEVLRNDDTAQAVSDGTTGVVAANFFKDEDASVPLWDSPIIKADKKASVTTRETNTETTIGISDPTQHNQGKINVEFLRPAYGVLALDPGVTVTQLSPTIKLTVDAGKYPGTDFSVRLKTDAPPQPGQPALQATPHNGHVTLSWNLTGGESSYTVKYGTDPQNLSQSTTVNTTSATNVVNVPNLVNGTKYYFSVTAVGPEQQSFPSDTVDATPNDLPNPTVQSAATEDAFVRDGAANESTNYGSLDRLEVKTDGNAGSGYNRSAYVKFDLSQLTDRVDSAKLTLTSTSGTAGITNQIRAVATDAPWSETSVTHLARPASAGTGISFPAPAVGQSADVDVTAAVQAAISAGKTEVSLQVLSPFGQGSGGQVNYASSENSNAAARPQLTINAEDAPSVPQVTVAAVGVNSVTLNWPYVGGAQRFKVTQTSAGVPPTLIDVPLASAAAQNASNSWQVTGLTQGTAYTFSVTAVAGAQNATSAAVTATPQLAANPAVSLPAVADGYVRDGTANADTNFGTVISMTVKNDAAGFTRHSYVKFDLASIGGRIDSAQLRLVPTSVGMTGVSHSAAVIADASWTETALTWNNRPVPGTNSATWTVPAAGTAVEVDLTSAVQTAKAAGATSITVVLTQNTNQGASSSVSYAAKESGTPANRPALKIN